MAGEYLQGGTYSTINNMRIYSSSLNYRQPSGWVEARVGRIYSSTGPAWRGYLDGGSLAVGKTQYVVVEGSAGSSPFISSMQAKSQYNVWSVGARTNAIPYTSLYASMAEKQRKEQQIMYQAGFGAAGAIIDNRLKPSIELTQDLVLESISSYTLGLNLLPYLPDGTKSTTRKPSRSAELLDGLGAYAEYRWRDFVIDKDSIFWVFRQKSTERIKGGLSYRFAKPICAFIDLNMTPKTGWETHRWMRGGLRHELGRISLMEGYEGQKGFAGNSDGGFLNVGYKPCDSTRFLLEGQYQKRRGNHDLAGKFIWRDIWATRGEAGYRIITGLEAYAGFQLIPHYSYFNDRSAYLGMSYNFFVAE